MSKAIKPQIVSQPRPAAPKASPKVVGGRPDDRNPPKPPVSKPKA